MTDISLTEPAALNVRAATARKVGVGDARFRLIAFLAAVTVLLIFAGVIVALIGGALPAIRAFGLGFITTEAWRPAREIFGALGPIYGTLITSAIAIVIAVPVGIGIAIFLTEICPRFLRRPIGIAIELLAGVPSIIYGIWGLFVFAPWFQSWVQEPVIAATAGIPVLGTLFGDPAYGIGIFTAGLILSIMILPFISAVTRDVLEAVQMSVLPKVIETPRIAAVAKDGIQLIVVSRVTVRTNIDRLVGGAGEATIIARVGEGMVSTIGSAANHKSVLENPDHISKHILSKGLDAGTAYEILSIDIADVDVGANIGAKLQIDQANADKQIAQAKAEERRAMAVAMEQEMRARVVEAEAEVPRAMAEAFRSGNLGIMDYYRMKNLQADTVMREEIAGTGNDPADQRK